MNVAIVTEKKPRLNRQEYDREVLIAAADMNADYFLKLVESNRQHDLYVERLEDLGLQLIQLMPGFKCLKAQGHILHVNQIDPTLGVSPQVYFDLLYHIGELEEKTVSQRTTQALHKARARGVEVGRPALDAATIEKIYLLYHDQKKTIRQIAAELNVSVGTAYKYAKQSEKA